MTTALTQAFGGLYTKALARPVVHKGELLSVQRLRGIAVLMVLIVHIEDVARHFAGWENVHTLYSQRLGYSAADLFFVISGFIMAYITFTRPFNARSWAISRFIRIYPMYILFSGIVMLMWLRDPRMTMGTGEQSWTRVLMSMAGLPQADLPLLFVGWTVEHEIVFYTVVFLTASLLGRDRLYAVMATLSALALGRWLLRLATGIDFWDWHLASPYMIQFTLGVFLFRHSEQLAALGWKLPLAFSAVFLTLAMSFTESGTINHEPMSRVVLFGLAYSGLLLAFLNGERERRARGHVDTHRDTLVWIGDASYSIYLTHPFVLGAFGKLFGLWTLSTAGQWALIAVASMVMMGVGLVTHVLVERQVMDMGRWLSRPRSAAAKTEVAR
jgi:exopolysaccharide production protein ExoZ